MSAVRRQQKRGGLLSAVCRQLIGGLLSAVRRQQKRGGLLSAVRQQKERWTVVCDSSAEGEVYCCLRFVGSRREADRCLRFVGSRREVDCCLRFIGSRRGVLLSAVHRQQKRCTVVCDSSAAEDVDYCVRFVGRKRG